MPPSLSHISLARIIEGANAEALWVHVDVMNRLFPEVGAEAIRVAGGVASFVGREVPVSYAVGLGLDGPVDPADVARIVEFFRSHDMTPRIDVCPHADPSLMTALREQHFRLHWFVNVLSRPLSSADEFAPVASGILVREARPDEDMVWATVADEGFGEGKPMTEARRQLGLLLFHRPNTYPYLAEVEGHVVGAGVVFTHHEYAALAATSVRPAYRRRGVHAALIRTRLAKARELGCTTAGYFCEPGGGSQRNAERHGFRVVYTKAVMKADE